MMADISPSTLLLASFAFVFSLYTILFIRSAYFTPLRHIPGPWHAKFTNIWLKTQNLRGRRMLYIHDLHLKYGPVIRIAPQEIDVADLDGFREIHRIGSGFQKTRWYEVMRNAPVPDIFAILDSKKHSDRRKLYARPFSNTSLRDNWEYVVKAKVEFAVARLKREAKLGSADIYKWWTLMTTDVICTLSFGEDFQMLEKGELSREIIDMEKGAALGGARAEFETLYAILKWLKIPGLRKIMDAPERILEYSKVAVSNARAGNLGSSNIFSAVLAENEKGTGALTDLDLAVEASGLIVAGSGTTAVTLTYLVWAVISNPDVQRQLQDEVAILPTSFSDKELEALPYLNAVVDESLRLYGAAPSSLPRVVPQRGAIFKGYHVPAGTIVNTQAYTMHREAEIFREPYKFEPARFLDGITKEQRAALSPFGAGARTCLGMHLARMELRHATAEFFRECAGAMLAPSTTPKSMEMVNYFLITPAGEKCDVILR